LLGGTEENDRIPSQYISLPVKTQGIHILKADKIKDSWKIRSSSFFLLSKDWVLPYKIRKVSFDKTWKTNNRRKLCENTNLMHVCLPQSSWQAFGSATHNTSSHMFWKFLEYQSRPLRVFYIKNKKQFYISVAVRIITVEQKL
jgi:hypothetical protein